MLSPNARVVSYFHFGIACTRRFDRESLAPSMGPGAGWTRDDHSVWRACWPLISVPNIVRPSLERASNFGFCGLVFLQPRQYTLCLSIGTRFARFYTDAVAIRPIAAVHLLPIAREFCIIDRPQPRTLPFSLAHPPSKSTWRTILHTLSAACVSPVPNQQGPHTQLLTP